MKPKLRSGTRKSRIKKCGTRVLRARDIAVFARGTAGGNGCATCLVLSTFESARKTCGAEWRTPPASPQELRFLPHLKLLWQDPDGRSACGTCSHMIERTCESCNRETRASNRVAQVDISVEASGPLTSRSSASARLQYT